ncbi:MAG: MurR/RpiR family transcriptional regulator [Ruminococcaceae bacterium]|nr:MurR/RpiR family transcriptional regulator [Oscillospiraceae bacterium]
MRNNLLGDIALKMPSLSKGQKILANYVTEHYDKAAYMTAARLGEVVGVSESTVVRFAIGLGFEGYPDLRRALQELVRTNLTSFRRMEVTDDRIGNGDVLASVLSSDSDNIRKTLEEIDRTAFDTAIERITSAEKIYIMGVRSSAFIASFLGYNLRMIFDNVKLVESTSGSEMFEEIMNIGENDVMIAISFPRYSKRIINAVNYAKRAGANVIAITDGEKSPIASGASQLLMAKSDMASFVDSLVAPLSIVNAIIVALARKNRDELAGRLRRLEEIWDEYDVYDKSHS